MHILDFIMYLLLCNFLWFLLAKFSNNNLTEELGSLIGLFIMFIFTIIYIIIFVLYDNNWIDIFKSTTNWNIKF